MGQEQQEIMEEYFKWKKDTGKCEYKLTDVISIKDGKVNTESRMAHVMQTSPSDWEEFCKYSGREYIGEMCLIAK